VKFDLDYARSVIKAEACAISEMGEIINGDFKKAVELLYATTGVVIVTGVGKAGIIGEKISATLASTGTPSHFLHSAEALHGDLGRVQENDVVVALSFSGESEEIIRLVNPIKQREIKLIAITGDSESSLARHSDVVLCIGKLAEACPLGIAPSVSTTCMLALGDALAFTVMKAREFSTEDYARFHPGGALGAKLMTVGQAMMFKHGEALPQTKVSDSVKYMLEETARLKRRGAVMVVDGKGRLAGIITDADLRRAMAEKGGDTFALKAEDIMSANCKRVTEDTLASEAMAIFHKHRIDDLPVVDAEDKPVGMIDVQDVFAIKIVG